MVACPSEYLEVSSIGPEGKKIRPGLVVLYNFDSREPDTRNRYLVKAGSVSLCQIPLEPRLYRDDFASAMN